MSEARILLAIESSTNTGSVALGRGPDVLAEISSNVRRRHSASLVPAVDQLMQMAGLAPSDLDGVVVGAGPGSFTGMRIAAGTAKGMIAALGIPLVAHSSLLVAAAPALALNLAVCALFDARGNDVYAGLYRPGENLRPLVPPCPMTLDAALDLCDHHGIKTIVGDAVVRHFAQIEKRQGVVLLPEALGAPRAASLLWLASRYPAVGIVTEPRGWEPAYLHASGAERAREAVGGGGAKST